jgi:hypothetical protein
MTKTIKFYRVSEPYGEFSNFPDFPITIDGKVCQSSERWFQSKKFSTTSPKDELEVFNAETSRKSADMGRERTRPLRADWNSEFDMTTLPDYVALSEKWNRYVGRPMLVKDYFMLVPVRAKFTQHDVLTKLLLSTNGFYLIEHTENDGYWADNGDGTGVNMLGKILMIVREELEEQAAQRDIAESSSDVGC